MLYWRTSGTGSSRSTGACAVSGMRGGARPAGRSSLGSGSDRGRQRPMAEAPLPRILLVDDDPDIARLVQHILSKNGLGPAVQVASGREALSVLNEVDIVLLDQQLPDTSGLDVLDAIRSRPAPPAVMPVPAHGHQSPR